MFIICIIVLITIILIKNILNESPSCICYNDYINLYDKDKLVEDLRRLHIGNWNSEYNRQGEYRGIGVKNPAYEPGSDVNIIVLGSDDFKTMVTTTIQKYAQPFVNLNFKFVTDASQANYTIASGSPPSGYTGWTNNIGGKTVTMTLGNQRQMNILHELGHALGMVHENFNIPSAPELANAITSTYGHDVGSAILRQGQMASSQYNATQLDTTSIMGIPNGSFASKRTSEYSELDKVWLAKTYGKPGSGKEGVKGW